METKNVSPQERPADLQAMIEKLWEKGVVYSKLFIFMLGSGGEQILGESVTFNPSNNEYVIRNPKRFIRLQQMTQAGLQIDFLLADLDMIEGGVMVLTPVARYAIDELDVASQRRYCNLILEYLDFKMKQRAVNSGLVLPQGPFKKPNLEGK